MGKSARTAVFLYFKIGFIFGFGQNDMQHDPHDIHLPEYDVPLVEFRTVILIVIVNVGPGVHLFAVTVGVHGQEIDRADDPFAFAVFPAGIAGPPGADVRRIVEVTLRAVKIVVFQKCLRTVGSAFEEITAVTLETQIVFADISETIVKLPLCNRVLYLHPGGASR